MKEISNDELKEIQLQILKSVTDFCVENNIRYFLCGGTLLGAVRHQGYIPWDDDIDLMMPRPDYERFLSEFNIENLKIGHYKINDQYPWPFIKISKEGTFIKRINGDFIKDVGVNIDVFPIDGFPNNSDNRLNHIRKLSRLRTIYWNQYKSWFNKNRNLKLGIEVFLSKIYFLFRNEKQLSQTLDKIAKSIDYNKSKNVGIALWGYGLREVNKKNVYNDTVKVTFENNLFDAPIKYDEYLTNVYGNYMEWPPIEKRVAHQGFVFLKK